MTKAERHSLSLLSDLLMAYSKHSNYQEIYPTLQERLAFKRVPKGRFETARWQYMRKHMALKDCTVLDIGANTGYFSMAAVESHAKFVLAIEGNADHAKFIQIATKIMSWSDRFETTNIYFDFEPSGPIFDFTFCLNVLHHLGDDFGIERISIDDARHDIAQKLRNLAWRTRKCWFQIGFNWKGNRSLPLFKNGGKDELIAFVHKACDDAWSVEDISIFDPSKLSYQIANDELLARFDNIGEFLNRPLFLLRSNYTD